MSQPNSFIQTVFISGVVLVALPLLHHLYMVHALSHMVEMMRSPNWSPDLPETPIVFYFITSGVGGLLMLISLGMYWRGK